MDSSRYSRQIALPQVGPEGQARLANSRVAIVGVGALGSATSLYLAAAGVGYLRLIDADQVNISNLQRQILHATPDIGSPKVDSASAKLNALNPEVEIDPRPVMISPLNAAQLLSDIDFVIDATDNFDARYLINDTCVAIGKPFCHGSIRQWMGQVTTYTPGMPDFRHLYPTPPPSAPHIGPLGMVAGVVGSLQASEALKYLLGTGTLLTGHLLIIDILNNTFTTLTYK